MRFVTISAAFCSGYRYGAENILRSIVVTLLLLFTPIPAHAVLIGLTANYADGTMFSVTYDDSDGDRLCSPCNLVSATATLGSDLQAVIGITAYDTFDVNLADLVASPFAQGSVFQIGPSPHFQFVFQSPDTTVSPTSGDTFDGLVFTHVAASLIDTRCETLPAGGNVEFGCPSGVGEADSGSSTLSSFQSTLSPQVVPAPATLALFGLGLAGLGWSRRKKA